MIKYIFCDIDGTLLDDRKGLSKDNIDSIKKAYEQGIKFIPCSGRLFTYGDALELLGISDSDNDYSIGGNGCIIHSNAGRIIKETYVDNELTVKLLDIFKEFDCDFYICSKEKSMPYGSGKQLDIIFNHNNPYTSAAIKGSFEEIVDIAKHNHIVKVQFINANPAVMETIKKRIDEISDNKVEYCYSEAGMLDVIKKGVDKKQGVLDFCEYFGIDLKETLAIGDNENDLEMLKCVGVSACPSNALDMVKESVDYVSPFDNNNSAVSDIIEKLVFNK